MGKVLGFEVLVCWDYFDFGVILFSEFIVVVEDLGFIVFLGCWVIDCVLKILVVWDVVVLWILFLYFGVNLLVIQVVCDDVVMVVELVLCDYGIVGNWFFIELIESVFVGDFDCVGKMLEVLKVCDVIVVMDDFGIGFFNFVSL